MSQHCHQSHSFEGVSPAYKQVLLLVIAINFVMFITETIYGLKGQSQALQADALDFLGDSLTYSLSFWAIGKSVSTRSNVALIKAATLIVLALWVLGKTLYHFIVANQPDPLIMGWVAILALAANLLSVLLLLKYRDGDANVRSVWLCSRNDAVGNVLVIIASILVLKTNSAWPDLIVALILATLFLNSAISIIKQSLNEKNDVQKRVEEDHC